MPGRPRTIDDDAVLAALAQAISRAGPARLTLADVAVEVGLAPATLVQRFGSKRGLLLAFAEWETREVAAVFAAARQGADSPIAALTAALIGLTYGIETPEALANHLAFSQMQLGDREFRRTALTRLRTMRDEIRALIEAAVGTGELVRCQSARVARAVQTTYTGSLLTWTVAGEGALADWLGEDLDLMLQPYRPL